MVAPKRKSAENESEHAAKRAKSARQESSKRLIRPRAEPEFARGGADPLTPAERKQIAVQAAQDILFEDVGANRVALGGSDSHGADSNGPQTSQTKPKRRQRDARTNLEYNNGEKATDRILCEGLTTKKLIPGAKVLGRVCQIRRNELVLALPNNLTGFVSITAISDGVLNQLEASTDDEHNENQKRHSAENEVALHSMFQIGQYLRAAVISLKDRDEPKTARKQRIELSVNPKLANHGLLGSDIAVNATIQTEILSIEDHGIVLGIHLSDSDIRGFVSYKDFPDLDKSPPRIGAVMLGLVSSIGSNGKILKMSLDAKTIGNIGDGYVLSHGPGVGVLQPGTAVNVTVSAAFANGLVGSVLGLINVMADVVHTRAWAIEDGINGKYAIGSKVQGRIIWTSDANDEPQMGVTLLPHILAFETKTPLASSTSQIVQPKIGEIIKDAVITNVQARFGLFMSIGPDAMPAFVHISRIADEKVESLTDTTGPYIPGTVHPCRLLGRNDMDGLFLGSLAPKTLALPFLRIEELHEGQIVQGTIEKLTEAFGVVTGTLVKLTESIIGFVPVLHLSDIALNHPERKFRPGVSVTARVLAVEPESQTLRLTLKKTLVNSDAPVWLTHEELRVGVSAPGTLVKFVQSGAIVQFFGSLKGLLPLSQMSESYITDPQQHFRLGQVVNVRILSIDPSENRLILTCRSVESYGPEQEQALQNIELGSQLSGKVVEKSRNEIVLEISPTKLTGILPFEHLTDGSEPAVMENAKRIHIGQNMKQVKVLRKDLARGRLELTKKPSLLKSNSAQLPSQFEDLSVGASIDGYISNVTEAGVFVSFLGNLNALLPKRNLSKELRDLPDFGFRRNQSISVYVSNLDHQSHRVTLSQQKLTTSTAGDGTRTITNPVDGATTSLSDFIVGKLTRARVTAVNATQLNVQLADKVRGRIDVSQAFDSWDDIEDKKYPLKQFNVDQEIPVRVMGTHDSKTHRFLPISHFGKACVYELSAKSSTSTDMVPDITSIHDVSVGSSCLCFVNNVTDMGLWVNLSPTVRGRIPRIEMSEYLAASSALEEAYPVGSAIRATVIKINSETDRLELSARPGGKSIPRHVSSLSIGSVLPALVTKVSQEGVMVQLSEDLSAPIHLVDLEDDFTKASADSFEKGQMVRVCIRNKDEVKNTMRLSTRPSKVLSSSLIVVDREILSLDDLKVNEIVRGFIKNVAPNGLFVAIASDLNALVKIADISDSYVKDWAAGFQPGQLVRGKIISIESGLRRLGMSLKESVLKKDFTPLLTYKDVHVGEIVKGKIRKVEDYGVFVVLDDSANVSGLCHRTEIADEKIGRVDGLYDEGDSVRAIIIKVDVPQRRISLSMKPSRLATAEASIVDIPDEESDYGETDVTMIQEPRADARAESIHQPREDLSHYSSLPMVADDPENEVVGLSAGGFSFSLPDNLDNDGSARSDSDLDESPIQKPKRNKAKPIVDRTAELDAEGPRSNADFERLLLSQMGSSVLWLQYMASELQRGGIHKARAVAERAVRSINNQSAETEQEALNAWVGYLNLEQEYGDEASLESVFERACEVNDPQVIYGKLVSAYIQSRKTEKADNLLAKMVKKFSQDAAVWENYAAFLYKEKEAPDRARELLPKALQCLPAHTHVDITREFARLEFRYGEAERGRTIFEGLFSNFPKRLDLWNVLLDLEMKASDKEEIRGLFERVTSLKLKPRQAQKFFNRWLAFEDAKGDERSRERVKARASEFVKRHKDIAT